MPLILDWQHVALRLILTVVAGLAIGFNRGEHGRPAGMRTTLLVCLAASISMIQANLLMNTVGKAPNSFIVLDLMRLPLGILSGMGFIGAGAIIRKDNMVLGVTTAATLWFTTVMGLCFGGGQLSLGCAALVLGLLTLWGLKRFEQMVPTDVRCSLCLSISADGPTDAQLRAMIARSGCKILTWGITYSGQGRKREVRGEIQRRILSEETRPPDFLLELARNPRVENLRYDPQGVTGTASSTAGITG